MRRAARLLVHVGAAAAVAGLSKIHAAWVAEPPYDYTGSSRFAWSVTYIAILGIASYGAGLPDLPRNRRQAWSAGLVAAAAAAGGISLIQLAAGDALLPRYVVFGAAIVVVPWWVVCAGLASGGRSRAEDRDRVLLVASQREGEALETQLGDRPERHARVVDRLDPDEAAAAGVGKPLVERAVEHGATVVVLDHAARSDQSVVDQAGALHAAGVRVRTLSLFYEEWLGKLPVSELERVSLMFDVGELHRLRYGRVKRMLDLALGLVGLVLLALVVPLVIVGNVVGNQGPLLYRQERVGRRGLPFRILKLRTMRPAADGLPDEWTAEDDPRITPFGRFLRRTHIDELPQVINVVRGDLSVVGPRPEQPAYVAELAAKLPFYDFRHLVRPGITGWAQVKYGYAGSEADALEKLQYEFFYLRRQGLGLDLRIIGRTIRSVLLWEGR